MRRVLHEGHTSVLDDAGSVTTKAKPWTSVVNDRKLAGLVSSCMDKLPGPSTRSSWKRLVAMRCAMLALLRLPLRIASSNCSASARLSAQAYTSAKMPASSAACCSKWARLLGACCIAPPQTGQINC